MQPSITFTAFARVYRRTKNIFCNAFEPNDDDDVTKSLFICVVLNLSTKHEMENIFVRRQTQCNQCRRSKQLGAKRQERKTNDATDFSAMNENTRTDASITELRLLVIVCCAGRPFKHTNKKNSI